MDFIHWNDYDDDDNYNDGDDDADDVDKKCIYA